LVITADFRQIAFEETPQRREGLFRASISAFSNITRPSRNEIAQIDDLAMGLYDSVSREGRHYAASVLSKCDDVPSRLLARLANEPVDISAPILIGSRVLSDVDLIGLISRHGLPHARVIARRKNINPVILDLIRLLNVKAAHEQAERQSRTRVTGPVLDEVRDQLRSLVSHGARPNTGADTYRTLRNAALVPAPDAFPRALSRILDITEHRAEQLSDANTYSDLLIGLKSLDLSEEQAFFIVAALYPAEISYDAAIRLFVERYSAISLDEALRYVEAWRRQDARAMAGGRVNTFRQAHPLAMSR
jgi:uncharacterized protein (DUF2336 family)